jgi:hypothetical protein
MDVDFRVAICLAFLIRSVSRLSVMFCFGMKDSLSGYNVSLQIPIGIIPVGVC